MDLLPGWAPDGRSVTYRNGPLGEGSLWSTRAEGTGEPELVFDGLNAAKGVWSPDGEWLVLRSAGVAGDEGARDIFAIRPGVDSAAVPPRIGLDASVTLSSPQTAADLTPALLVATVAAAAAERQPDLSRSTYRELLSSGRIDLIQSIDVRVALADYDRLILETDGVWVNLSPKLRIWVFSRIPNDVWERLVGACSRDAADPLYNVRGVCEFDLGAWSARDFRRDVLSTDAQQRFVLAGHRFRTGLEVTENLRGLATELVETLERSLSGT